jgi:hypothetical protein
VLRQQHLQGPALRRPGGPMTKKPTTCTLCDRDGHEPADCPFKDSPTPLLASLMGRLMGGN